MKKLLKQALSIVLVVVMVFGAAPLAGLAGIELPDFFSLFAPKAKAEENAASGTCGENLTWEFDEATGTLTISGEGEMFDYGTNGTSFPWKEYKLYIKNLKVGFGTTSIGMYAFAGCYNLVSVELSESVEKIRGAAFEYCSGLSEVFIPKEVNFIGDSCFNSCVKLEKITVDTANGSYSNDNYGVLFDKNKSTLIRCPENNQLTRYIIPNTVTNIGDFAFYGCNKLSDIDIPNSVKTIGSFAFEHCEQLTEIVIPSGVETIGSRAFGGCKQVYEVFISDTVTTIDASSFSQCFSLNKIIVDENNKTYSSDSYGVLFDDESLIKYPVGNDRMTYTIPDGVKSIGIDAFYGCKNLSTLFIPEGLLMIGNSAFMNCSKLNDVNIPDSVISIGGGAFESTALISDYSRRENGVLYLGSHLISGVGCGEKEYTVKNGTKTISSGAFAGSSIVSITIPDTVKHIGSGAFDSCYDLSNVKLPDGLKTIGVGLFRECISLISITIPESVEIIEEQSFMGCSSLDNVILPENEIVIRRSAFEDTKIINDYSKYENDVLYIGNHLITAKETISGLCNIKPGTKTIADQAFAYCDSLKSLKIPTTVKYIGIEAFYKCENIESVYFEGNIKDWLDITFATYDAFDGWFDETSNPLYSGAALYFEDQLVTDLVIPKNIEIIKPITFFGCESIESISLEDDSQLTHIGCQAFFGCVNLDRVSLDKATRLNIIDTNSFCNYRDIESITLPASVNVINAGLSAKNVYFSGDIYDWCKIYFGVSIISSDSGKLFFNGELVTDLVIPNDITEIKDYAFYGCSSITSLEIVEGSQIKELGLAAFAECYNLEKVILPDGLVSLSRAEFRSTTNLKQITIPSSVEIIGDAVFFDSGIEKVDFEENSSLQIIGALSFSDTDIKYIEIPETVTEIGTNAFYRSGLKTVIFKGNSNLKSIGSDAFRYCTALEFFEIPEGVTSVGEEVFDLCYSLKRVHIPPSVLVIGNNILSKTTACICSSTEDCYAKTYADENGYTFKLCDGHEDECKHIPTTITVSATCKATGMSYDVCMYCGISMGNEIVLPKTDHTPGDWIIIVNPTTEAEGKRVKKCMVCGEVVDEENTSKLAVIVDEDTGVEFIYNPDDYEGKPKLKVEESFDEVALQIVNLKTGAVSQQIFNITMLLDGDEIQPKDYVTIKIPVPENFDSDYIHIYYVNSKTGNAEKLESWIEDGFVVFSTDHFSYYALVQKVGEIEIRKPSITEIKYGDSIILHADVKGALPEGATIEWTASNENFTYSVSADGTTCTISPSSSGDTTFTATVYDESGNVISEDTQVMTSKAGFFQKIIAFFKKLFGMTKLIPEEIRYVFR